MDSQFYEGRFEAAIAGLRLGDADLRFFVGPMLNSVVLKVYKAEWASDRGAPVTSLGRIFFSIWVTEKSVGEGRLLYNIHALKLREFKGYKITSRDFASRFRDGFKAFQKEWPNVSVAFGPQTLMEGWVSLDNETLETDIVELVRKFERVSPVIDEMLAGYGR